MKILLYLGLVPLYLFSMEHKSNISFNYINYNNFSNESLISGDTKLKYTNDNFEVVSNIEYLYSDKYLEKRYITLNEFYISKDYDEYSFTFGKIIKFNGELEGYNITDIFNQKNYLADPFDKSKKIGSWSFISTKYFDDDSLELGVKFYEEDVKYPSNNSPYFPFSSNYDENLKLSNSQYKPTISLQYNFSSNEDIQSETKLILIKGYDNKRYFIPNNLSTLNQYAYEVNKFLVLSNILYEDYIFKFESSYTDIVDDKNIANYSQISLGFEKSFYDIKDIDLTFYSEYYKYIYDQNNKIQNIDIGEIYNNDIFLAFRLNFNDTQSSELKSGILYDLSNYETIYKVELKSRIKDNLVLNIELLDISSKENTVLTYIGNHTRAMVGLTYTF